MSPQCPAVSLEQLKACARKNERSRTDAGFGGDKPHLPTMIFLHDVLAVLCLLHLVNEPGRRTSSRASCSGLSVGARTRGRGRALAGPRGLGSPWLYLVVRLVSFRLLMERRTSLPPPLQASKPSQKKSSTCFIFF